MFTSHHHAFRMLQGGMPSQVCGAGTFGPAIMRNIGSPSAVQPNPIAVPSAPHWLFGVQHG
jgi:hypothetical protein